ncbi:MAG: ABC transporter ATP-binding protein [Gammaproteobacteria bacterium]|nr:ABC transporter ATP-binding protein [Gammaproteobacteria bacterium]MBU1553598.1 ABC transporter ATP-binding protein [Gammaproteobacteria bacterium]MBU2070578.1 ABC transporter ATP-binding protein [Gammaproteobacteria bacterium]MBU2182000.1 ABC transporter ATP-binding protein [Gammaproteobacteria bacterium]MBU2207084.1 ABC transporter ATP-binding protein [Gammaproteobacteria bacterium]
MLNLSAVCYRYPGADTDALCSINLSLQAGDIVGLLGPNGAGKTTLFSVLSGLTQPSQGQIQWQHKALRVGLIPQHLAFYGQLSIAENLAFFADIYQLKGQVRQQQLQQVIAACDLGSRLQQRAATLSGGWQRRLNFAIGILRPAELYLFDEATVGVDAQSRQQLLTAVQQLAAVGKTLIYTSHYLQETEQIANRILVLQQGALVLDLPVSQLAVNSRQLMLQWPQQAPAGWTSLLTRLGLEATKLAAGELIPLQNEQQWQQLNQFIQAQAVQPLLLRYGKPSLEQLYLHASGGQL